MASKHRPEQRLRFIPSGESFNWFSFLRALPHDGTFGKLVGSTLIVGLYAAAMVYAMQNQMLHISFGTSLHSILGITLGLLLVIRTNTAYERWWEGRKLVGSMVNSCRGLALKLDAYLGSRAQPLRASVTGLLADFAVSVKEHLRDGVDASHLTTLSPAQREALTSWAHPPLGLLTAMTRELQLATERGELDALQRLQLTRELEVLTDVVGACERIKKSPLPFAYTIHLKIFILVFILTLPLGMVESFGWYTVPGLVLVFYAMAGLELIGEEIEDPFGTDLNDIPMDAIAENIRKNVLEILTPGAANAGA